MTVKPYTTKGKYVTVQLLKELRACASGVDAFKALGIKRMLADEVVQHENCSPAQAMWICCTFALSEKTLLRLFRSGVLSLFCLMENPGVTRDTLHKATLIAAKKRIRMTALGYSNQPYKKTLDIAAASKCKHDRSAVAKNPKTRRATLIKLTKDTAPCVRDAAKETITKLTNHKGTQS